MVGRESAHGGGGGGGGGRDFLTSSLSPTSVTWVKFCWVPAPDTVSHSGMPLLGMQWVFLCVPTSDIAQYNWGTSECLLTWQRGQTSSYQDDMPCAPGAAPLGAVEGLSTLSGAQGGLPGGGDMDSVGRGSQAAGLRRVGQLWLVRCCWNLGSG